MSNSHLTYEALLALASADESSSIVGGAAAHLSLCSLCRELLERLPEECLSLIRPRLATVDPAKRFSVLDYRKVCQRAADKYQEEESRVEADRSAAYALFDELESYPIARRRMIAANMDRFRSWALAEHLLERSKRAWTDDPEMAEVRAVLACDIAGALQAEGYRELLLNDLRAEAWSFVANACRIRGHLEEAERAFEVAEEFLENGSGELFDRAQLLDLKVSLWRDFGQVERAFAALEQVIACRRSLGDLHLVGRGLISKALLLEDQGQWEQAVSVLREAESLVDVSREPLLELNRRTNLVANLLSLRRVADAQEGLPRLKQLARMHGSRLDRLRALRIEGQVLYACGQKALGEELLRSVHESFLGAGVPHEAASVALYLAEILLAEGRAAEVRDLSERVKAYALLALSEADREAVAALAGLPSSVEDIVLTRGLIERIAHHLRPRSSHRGLSDSEL